MKALI